MMGFDPLVQFLHEVDAIAALHLAVVRDVPGHLQHRRRRRAAAVDGHQARRAHRAARPPPARRDDRPRSAGSRSSSRRRRRSSSTCAFSAWPMGGRRASGMGFRARLHLARGPARLRQRAAPARREAPLGENRHDAPRPGSESASRTSARRPMRSRRRSRVGPRRAPPARPAAQRRARAETPRRHAGVEAVADRATRRRRAHPRARGAARSDDRRRAPGERDERPRGSDAPAPSPAPAFAGSLTASSSPRARSLDRGLSYLHEDAGRLAAAATAPRRSTSSATTRSTSGRSSRSSTSSTRSTSASRCTASSTSRPRGAACSSPTTRARCPLDGLMLRIAVRREHPPHRDVRWLAEDGIFHFPFLGNITNRVGAVRACQENAERLLEQRVARRRLPRRAEGHRQALPERYRLQRFGRGGFVKLCLRTRTPIVPVAIVGGEETNPMLARVEYLTQALGIPYLPVTPTFPLLGPAGLLPAPTKWKIFFGEPIDLEGYGAGVGGRRDPRRAARPSACAARSRRCSTGPSPSGARSGSVDPRRPMTAPSLDGVLVIDKPRGPTSHDVVRAPAARARHARDRARGDARSDGDGRARRRHRRGDQARALADGARQGLRGDHRARRGDRHARRRRRRRGRACRRARRSARRSATLRRRGGLAGRCAAALETERARDLRCPPRTRRSGTDGERAFARARRGERVELEPRPVVVRRLELVGVERRAAAR